MKKTSLFDKCHIHVYVCKYTTAEIKAYKILESIANGKRPVEIPDCYYNKYTKDNIDEYALYINREKHNKIQPVYENVIHESPLGFYYATPVCINEAQPQPVNEYTRTNSVEYTIVLNETIYHISYFDCNGDTCIGPDTRPWQLLDTGMNEHYIMDLFKVLTDIKETVMSETNGKNIKCLYPSYSDETFKKMYEHLMTDIFGFPEGPKFQTNDEKIVAAGFDLKTSFRKM